MSNQDQEYEQQEQETNNEALPAVDVEIEEGYADGFEPVVEETAEETAEGQDSNNETKRPKDIPAQLRFDQPIETVTDEWIKAKAAEFKKAKADFIIYYLSNDFLNFLVSDWRDALPILRNLINQVYEYQPPALTCFMIDGIVRDYDEFVSAGIPIPDPFRLSAFVNEVVERALCIPLYRESLEKSHHTTNHGYLRAVAMDRILPRPTRLVMQRAGILQDDWVFK